MYAIVYEFFDHQRDDVVTRIIAPFARRGEADTFAAKLLAHADTVSAEVYLTYCQEEIEYDLEPEPREPDPDYGCEPIDLTYPY